MTVTNWSGFVNTKFYSFSKMPKENTKSFDSISGRSVSYQVNSRAVMIYTCSLEVKRPDEENAFWTWFNDELGGLAGAFKCSAVGDGFYRFTEIPSPQDTKQKTRVLNLQFEEVF